MDWYQVIVHYKEGGNYVKEYPHTAEGKELAKDAAAKWRTKLHVDAVETRECKHIYL